MRRIQIDQTEIDPISFQDTVEHVFALLLQQRTHAHYIVTPNAQFVHLAHTNQRYAQIIRNADLSVADGMPLVWASHLLGCPLPGRVNGTNLMMALCEKAAHEGRSIYLLGGKPGSAELAVEKLREQFPGLRVAGIDCPPHGFHEDAEMDAAVCARINVAQPDLLFAALGSPKQEYWLGSHTHVAARVMLGIGGSFELIGGLTRRAPRLLQELGLEWLWRLVMEPRRLWKRYLVGNTVFVYLVLRQKLTRKPVPCGGRA